MCILKKIIIYKCIFKSIFYNNKKKTCYILYFVHNQTVAANCACVIAT